MKYVWDEQKNRANIQKHGVSFALAVHVFEDPLRKEYYDERHSGLKEDRFIIVGFSLTAVLVVVFTEPDINTVRIISARRARKYELEAVHYGNG